MEAKKKEFTLLSKIQQCENWLNSKLQALQLFRVFALILE